MVNRRLEQPDLARRARHDQQPVVAAEVETFDTAAAAVEQAGCNYKNGNYKNE